MLEGNEGRSRVMCEGSSYRCCKKFGHLAYNCRNVKEERGKAIPLNKFEILSSRVMQSEDEGRTIRRVEAVVVECYKYGKKGHKCRKWEKEVKRVAHFVERKVHQKEKRVRRVEEEEAACVAKLREVQQGREGA